MPTLITFPDDADADAPDGDPLVPLEPHPAAPIATRHSAVAISPARFEIPTD
jgi:hypothetical protein